MRVMHVIPTVLFASAAAHASSPMVGIYWEPPGAPTIAKEARAAFAETIARLGAPLLDGASPAPGELPSLVPALEAAKKDYARFAFPEAIAKLDDLQRMVDARGGGDLDARQLSELFFYRGLARLETGAADAAWDDLVRAARLDLARVVDPARFPPRAVNAYSRAVGEVAKLPHAMLTVDAPAGARVKIDGAAATGSTAVTLGPHFVAVAAEGYEPWAAVVAVTGAQQQLVPPLHAWQPPDGDRLFALAGERHPDRIVLGALERTPGSWRFVVRDLASDGKFVSDSVGLDGAPVAIAVGALLHRLFPLAPPALPPPPPRVKWWKVALLAGGAAVLAALAIGFGVVYGTAPTVGGQIGALH